MSGFRNFGTMLAQGFGTPGAFDAGVEEEMRARSAMDRARMVRDQAEQRERIEETMRESGIDPSQAAIMANAMRGGFANLPQAFSARDSMQGYDFRDRIADPGTDIEMVNRLRAAQGQTPFNPMQATGGQGQFFNVMEPEAGIQLSDLGQAIVADVDTRRQGRVTRDTATADAAAALAERRRTPSETGEPDLVQQAETIQAGDPSSIDDLALMGLEEALAEIDRLAREAIDSGRNPQLVAQRVAELRRQLYGRQSMEGAQ